MEDVHLEPVINSHLPVMFCSRIELLFGLNLSHPKCFSTPEVRQQPIINDHCYFKTDLVLLMQSLQSALTVREILVCCKPLKKKSLMNVNVRRYVALVVLLCSSPSVASMKIAVSMQLK